MMCVNSLFYLRIAGVYIHSLIHRLIYSSSYFFPLPLLSQLITRIHGFARNGNCGRSFFKFAPSGVEKVQAPPLSLSGNCKSATLPSPPLYNKTSPLQHQHYFLRGRASYNFVFCGIAYQGTINPFTLFLFLTKFLLKYLESYHT